jgi:hypothetical protein
MTEGLSATEAKVATEDQRRLTGIKGMNGMGERWLEVRAAARKRREGSG